jgi:hypothetical protein
MLRPQKSCESDQIGYVGQTLFNDTIARNIAYGAPGASFKRGAQLFRRTKTTSYRPFHGKPACVCGVWEWNKTCVYVDNAIRSRHIGQDPGMSTKVIVHTMPGD